MTHQVNSVILNVLVVIIGVGGFVGCGGSGAKQNGVSEVTPQSLGLDPATQSMGTDRNGRSWFKSPARDAKGLEVPGQYEQRVYNPKDKTLYNATKELNGEWKLTAQPEVTVESLRLGPGTVEMGKDPLGRYWFDDPTKGERLVYNPKTKKLHRATKDAAGKWE